MPLDLVIIGAGGFGREVRTIFQNEIHQAGLIFKGFLGKDHGAAQDPAILPYMLGDPEFYTPSPNDRFVLAVGEDRKSVV